MEIAVGTQFDMDGKSYRVDRLVVVFGIPSADVSRINKRTGSSFGRTRNFPVSTIQKFGKEAK